MKRFMVSFQELEMPYLSSLSIVASPLRSEQAFFAKDAILSTVHFPSLASEYTSSSGLVSLRISSC